MRLLSNKMMLRYLVTRRFRNVNRVACFFEQDTKYNFNLEVIA